MKKSEAQSVKMQQENEVLRRALLWLGAAAILEILVLLIDRYYVHFRTVEFEVYFAQSLLKVFQVLQYAGFIVGVAIFAFALLAKKRSLLLYILAAFSTGLGIIAVLLVHVGSGCISVLLVGIPAFGGLVMIYYLYQHEFFLSAFSGAVGIFGMWLFRKVWEGRITVYYGFLIAAICLVAVICIVTFLLQKTDGVWKRKEKHIEFFSKGANYLLIFATCAITAVALLGALLLGGTFAYYMLMGQVVWLFVLAVYYTSKLM